jgi:hypothetical protein
MSRNNFGLSLSVFSYGTELYCAYLVNGILNVHEEFKNSLINKTQTSRIVLHVRDNNIRNLSGIPKVY